MKIAVPIRKFRSDGGDLAGGGVQRKERTCGGVDARETEEGLCGWLVMQEEERVRCSENRFVETRRSHQISSNKIEHHETVVNDRVQQVIFWVDGARVGHENGAVDLIQSKHRTCQLKIRKFLLEIRKRIIIIIIKKGLYQFYS